MSSKANADKLNVEKAILEKDAKNHHAKLHEAQGLHNGARDNLMLHYIYFIPTLWTVNDVKGKDPLGKTLHSTSPGKTPQKM